MSTQWIEIAVSNGGTLTVENGGQCVIGGENISLHCLLARMQWEGIEEGVSVTGKSFPECLEKLEAALREDAADEMAANPKSGA